MCGRSFLSTAQFGSRYVKQSACGQTAEIERKWKKPVLSMFILITGFDRSLQRLWDGVGCCLDQDLHSVKGVVLKGFQKRFLQFLQLSVQLITGHGLIHVTDGFQQSQGRKIMRA